jgi:hypothetical protein
MKNQFKVQTPICRSLFVPLHICTTPNSENLSFGTPLNPAMNLGAQQGLFLRLCNQREQHVCKNFRTTPEK